MLSCLERVDATLFVWLNGHQDPSLDVLMPLVTQLGHGIVVAVLLLLVSLAARSCWWGRATTAGLSLAALALTGLANTTVKRVVARPRPLSYFLKSDRAPEGCATLDSSFRPRILDERVGKWSFPSGHSQAAFAGATALVGLLGLRFLPAFGVAFLVAYSRIYVGAHFPGDVLGGALVGALGGWLVLGAAQRYWPGLFWRAVDPRLRR
jgi:undecaprenyl-diphosphatase